MRKTKKSLLLSITAMILCCALLAGTTFAWFTDSASTGVNTIVAGNLDVEVEYSQDGNTWNNLAGTSSLFSTNKWEPGHTEVVYLKVHNAGSLALKYRVLVTPVTENGGVNVNGKSFKLSDYLVFGTTEPSETKTIYSREAARTQIGATTGLNANALTRGKDIAANGQDQYLALVVYMPENVGNVANYKTGTAAPTIELGIQVVATQKDAENDSFDNQYDAGAATDSFYTVGAYYDYYPQVSMTVPVAETGSTTIIAKGKLNSSDTQETTLAKVTVPADAVADDAMELTVKVVPKDPESDTTNGTALVNEINDPNRETANFDVKVEGIASNNQADIDVEIFVGKGLANVKVYHNGALLEGAFYDAATGVVTFTTTSFSDYTVAYDVAAAAIGDKTYGTLALAAAAAQDGETVKLLKDLDTGAGEAYPAGGNVYGIVLATISKNVTINGNGHKVTGTGTYILGLDQCTGNVTLTNIIVEGAGDTNKAAINMTGCNKVVLENVKASGVKTGVIVNNTTATIKGEKTDIANGAWHAVNVDNGSTYNPQNPVLTVESGKIGTIWCERSGSASITGGQIAVVGMAGTGAVSISGGEIGSVVKADNATGTIAVTGGKFATDPTNFCTDGYKAALKGDWYEIRCTKPVATVGEATYDLRTSEGLAAVLAMPEGSEISISGELTLNNPITFANPVNINLVDALITYSANSCTQQYLITVQNGSTFNMDATSSIVLNGDAGTQNASRYWCAVSSNGVFKSENMAGDIVINNARGRGINGNNGVEIENFSGSVVFNNSNGNNRNVFGIFANTGDVNIKNFTGNIKIDFGRGNTGMGVVAWSGNVSIENYAGSIDVQTNISHNAFGIYANKNVTIGDFTGSVYARGGSGSGYGVWAVSGDVAIGSISGSIIGDSFNTVMTNSQWDGRAIYAGGSIYGAKDGENYAPVQVTGTLSSTVSRTAAFTVQAGDKLYMDVKAEAVVKAQSSYQYGIAPLEGTNWGGGAVNFVAKELHVTCEDGSNVTAVSQTKTGTPVDSVCTTRQLSTEAATLIIKIPYGKDTATGYINTMSEAAKAEFANWDAIVAYIEALE